MTRKKKQTIILENIPIEDFAAEGKCISKVENQVIFVEGNVAPGDYADLRITKVKKKYKEAVAIAVRPLSELRTDIVCSHFGVCGGCKWQHIKYEQQLLFKTTQVNTQLEKIGKLSLPATLPIVASEETFYYRNKLEYTFSQNRWFTDQEIANAEVLDKDVLGFHVPRRYDKILHIDHCYLQPEPSNTIRLALYAFAKKQKIEFYELVKQEKGVLRNLIIRTATSGDVMVIVQFAKKEEEIIGSVMNFLAESFPEITSLNYVINTKGNDTFQDLEVITVKGLPYITETMEDLKYRIGPKSFFQTNPKQAYQLYKIARDLADLQGTELVYDLYTGTGTIANFIAKKARKVIGIEYVEAAIADAKINSEINGISNTDFFAGDMRKLLTSSFVETHGKPDVVVTDPPRAGMDEEVVMMLLEILPQKIVYISCNVATQARDVSLLDRNYQVKVVQPVDMFPQTHHVENIVLLELK